MTQSNCVSCMSQSKGLDRGLQASRLETLANILQSGGHTCQWAAWCSHKRLKIIDLLRGWETHSRGVNLPRIIHTSEGPGHPGGKTCSTATKPLVGDCMLCSAPPVVNFIKPILGILSLERRYCAEIRELKFMKTKQRKLIWNKRLRNNRKTKYLII